MRSDVHLRDQEIIPIAFIGGSLARTRPCGDFNGEPTRFGYASELVAFIKFYILWSVGLCERANKNTGDWSQLSALMAPCCS